MAKLTDVMAAVYTNPASVPVDTVGSHVNSGGGSVPTSGEPCGGGAAGGHTVALAPPFPGRSVPQDGTSIPGDAKTKALA